LQVQQPAQGHRRNDRAGGAGNQGRPLSIDAHLVSAPGFFAEAAKRGTFEKHDSCHWKDHVELLKKANQYSSYPYVVVPFAYTFQPVWNASCPGMEKLRVESHAHVTVAAL
jgi:hypothetical protein